jgi:hypothetical protein
MDSLARERHLHRLLDGLGVAEARCSLCGFAEPEALVRVPRGLLQRHHVGGAAQGGPEVLVCANCHAILTLDQQDRVHLLRADLPEEVRAALYLLDAAALQERLAGEARKRAQALLDRYRRMPAGRRLLRHPNRRRVTS